MSSVLGATQRMMRVGLGRNAFDFRDGDQRNKTQEQQEHGEEQAKCSDIHQDINPSEKEHLLQQSPEGGVEKGPGDEEVGAGYEVASPRRFR